MGTRKRSVPSIPSCFSGSPRRVPDKLYYIKKIKDQAKSVGIGDVDQNLDMLSDYISQYLEFIQHGGERPSQPNAAKIDLLSKVKDITLEAGQAVKAYFPDAKSVVQHSFQGLGATHILATGFLLVANIMERFDKIRHNSEICLSLLKGMKSLVQDVKMLRERHQLSEGMMKIEIEKAVELIIEVSLACCTQIEQRRFIQYFSTTVNKQALDGFQGRLTELQDRIRVRMGFATYDAVQKGRPPLPQVSDEFRTENRVHIEKVIALLEWKSNKKAVAVILYGLGGIGKTTLADAVYRTLCDKNTEACKNSYVRLFEKITDTPNIKELQTQILQDLMEPPIPEIRRCDVGRNQIESILQKEVVFIYIDGVLFPEVGQGLKEVEELLPRATENVVRKLRLLITARDKGAAGRAFKNLGIHTNFYPIETLPDTKAMELFKKELKGGETNPVQEQMNGWEERLGSSLINHIVQICGGIPSLLMELAKSIKSAKDVREAQEKCTPELFVKEIERYVFARKSLDKNMTDPFFDICLYFKEWDWEELSKIVGESELNYLEDMALVTKDIESMTAKVHNAILEIGLHYKGQRFKFTSGSEFQNFLNPDPEEADDQDLTNIKGIWASDISDRLNIPASKLYLMRKSLRVLALGNSTEVMGQCKKVFDELYFLSAGISHLPFDPSRLKKLRHLCYNPEDLHELSQMLSHLSNLRVLRLREAQLTSWTTQLKRLHQLPGNLVNGLRQRGSPDSLPKSIGQLNLLYSLELSLTNFRKLPDAFCSLSSLTELKMDNCRRLEELPGKFGQVTRLRKLSLVGCSSLKELPESFSKLNDLEDLNLSGCKALKKLCPEFKSLSSLKVLSLKECKELEELPEGFHLLALLEHLYLSDCHKLKGQPMENIVQMNRLQIVDIQRSPLLQERWQHIGVGCNEWSHKVRS